MTRLTVALALALATIAAVPASAAPSDNRAAVQSHTQGEHTCGFQGFEYDASGAPVGPYCH